MKQAPDQGEPYFAWLAAEPSESAVTGSDVWCQQGA